MAETTVTWDEAVSNTNFVTLEADEPKTIYIKDWKLVKETKKLGDKEKEVVEFRSACIEEDGEKVEKQFTTVSNRLKKKLRDILEDMDPAIGCKLTIIKVGDKFQTQYSVKKVNLAKE